MNVYELFIIFHPEVEDDWQERFVTEIENIISSSEGKIIRRIKKLGARNLAYPIKKQKKGIFFVMRFMCRPERLKSIHHILQFSERVLRFMMVRI